jgi:signal transduction histidine kinase
VRPFRRDVRQLAVELAAQGGHDPADLLAWFAPGLQRLPGMAEVQVIVAETTGTTRWEQATVELCSSEIVARLLRDWPATAPPAVSADQAPSRWAAEELLRSRVTVVVRTEYEGLQNLWLLRAAPGGELWGEEELNSLVLLAEQWVGVVRHSVVQAARAAAERRAWQAEKLSALGLLAGSLAHEIKNPLSSMKTLTAVALEESDPQSDHAASLRLVLQEIDRLALTTQQLLGFVRSSPSMDSACTTDVVEIVTATLQIVGHRARQQHVELRTDCPDQAVPVPIARDAVQSVLLNLVLNAIEACFSGGLVTVAVTRSVGHVQLAVRDNGPGIASDIQDHLFEPLATTKPHGTGLGLYSVAQTVRDAGGEISVESAPSMGTVFRVTFPLPPAGKFQMTNDR